jgi:hypothetical protein
MFLKTLLAAILEFLYGKVMDGLAAYIAAKRRKAEAEAARKASEAAVTPEERESAADQTRRNF